jgi:hypothetical protein
MKEKHFSLKRNIAIPAFVEVSPSCHFCYGNSFRHAELQLWSFVFVRRFFVISGNS